MNWFSRQNVLDLCKTHSIPVYKKNFALSEVYEADEAFVTGTFAGIIPIYEIDDLIPSIADSVYVADAATVIGNATLCEDVSVWSSAVIRADNDSIFIGAGTNIQEGGCFAC